MHKIKVLFVCTGNICRSPTAEVVFRHAVERAGMSDMIECDSAGTHDYHVGAPPDERAQAAGLRRGYDLSGVRGRQVWFEDFEKFDYVIAMDRLNLELLKRICPRRHAHKLSLLCDFNQKLRGKEVPDPYDGPDAGFEKVLDMIEDLAELLLEKVQESGDSYARRAP
jgi:protein-tyrosine phosphatase